MKLTTGITATGKLTLGNYLGVIKQLIKYQDDYEMYVFVADLHAIVLPIEKEELKRNAREIFALYISSGIDINKTKLFIQSMVPQHIELSYYLFVNTNIGELQRMIQFKEKSQGLKMQNGTIMIPSGLLYYPTLMASDILLYEPDIVPVGKDQTQHLELTRTIINRINKKYSLNFKTPKTMTNKLAPKIMDLKDPTKKMSKSSKNPDASIFMMDSDEEIRRKISTSLTDSFNKVNYDLEKQPGVSNLLTIISAIDEKPIEEVLAEYKDMNYKDFKETVSKKIIHEIGPIRDKSILLLGKREELDCLINKNVDFLQKEAQVIIDKIKEKIGLQ